MICVFPDPYPDELIYSVCARYKDLMKYPNSLTATRDFFGGGAISAIVDLPNRLEYLVSALPPGHFYTVDEFIDRHTMFPFYAPFLSSKRARVIRDEMSRVGENQVFERIGLNASRVGRPSWLRFCPVCAEEDRRQLGETYWHRIHQLSGIEVCPRHAVFLELTDAPYSYNSGVAISADSALRSLPIRQLNLSDDYHNLLLLMARNAAWLLTWEGGKSGSDFLRERYYNHLLRQGLAYYNGNIRVTELITRFERYYPIQILEALDCKINRRHRNWLLRLLHSGMAGVSQLPIRHILLILFLGYSTEEFFNSHNEYKPFGDGPWPCLNHTAVHYREPVITKCRVTDNLTKGKTGRPMGTFSCECGFVYNRVGPDNSEEDRHRVNSIESYGPVWEKVLREVWSDSSLPVVIAARLLGVSDLTVVRYAIRLNLPMNVPDARQVSLKTIERYKNFRRSRKEALKFYRRQWLSVLKANSDASRLQLMTTASFLYLWLKRNDTKWLEIHLPPVRKGYRKDELRDWNSIDTALVEKVEATAKRIRELPGRPIRVSMAAIMKEVGHKSWLEFRLNKLPLTSKALKDCLESFEDHLIRRVNWTEEYYSQEGKCPSRSSFLRLSGTNNNTTGRTPRVQGAIDAAMERLKVRFSSK